MQKICTRLLLLGLLFSNSSSAQVSVDSLLNELQKAKEDTNKVILYRMLTGTVMIKDPAKAVEYGKAGVELGKKLKYDRGVAGCYLNMSAAFNGAGKRDSGLTYIDSAIVWSHKAGEASRLALAYLNRADFHMQLRNLKQSLIDCDTALHYAQLANNNDRRARILQTIGSVYFLQKKYPESRDYYERAGKLYQEAGNKRMSAIILNNIGNIYKNTQEYNAAIENFTKATVLAGEAGDQINLSMYYGNMSDAYTQAGQYDKAEENARKAMALAVQQNNETQTGVSYNYLGQIFLKQKKYSQSIDAASKAYDIMQKAELLEEQQMAAEILAEAYALSGNSTQAYKYVLKSKELNDTLTKQKYDEDIAAMQTSFQLKEKNNEIALLNKDKQLQEQRSSRQQLLIAASLLLVALAVGAIVLLISRNRLRQRMKEVELRNSIAADLHDEVGSSLSSIYMLSEMASAEEAAPASRKEMLNKVTSYSKETMDKMGDIVWMIKPTNESVVDLRERMQRFLYEMCSSKNIESQIDVGDIEQIKLNMQQNKALYLIFKEAVNNALKYADPAQINVSLKKINNNLELRVSDNGKGFSASAPQKGNGLTNINNRARELGGKAEILSRESSGTTVIATIPL